MTKEEYEEELNHIQKARFSKEDKERLIRELTNVYEAEKAEKQREELDKLLSRAIIGTMDNTKPKISLPLIKSSGGNIKIR